MSPGNRQVTRREADDNVRPSPDRSKQSQRLRSVIRVAGPAIALLVISACSGTGPQSALSPEGPVADDLDELWNLVFSIAVVVFILVNLALLISLVRFRERKDDDRRPKQVHGNQRLEILWTIIPAVILAVIAVPTVRGIFELRTPPTGPDVLQVSITGHQWWWEFTYPGYTDDSGRELVTANELHIPVDTPVNLSMTSADVIHSFWVPPLNGKRDLVPGLLANLTLNASGDAIEIDNGFGAGVILGQCAEFCGLSHADMRVRVFVQTQEDFDAWVAQQLEPAVVPTEGLAAAGFETFNQVCTACHQSTVAQEDGTVETLGPENFIVLQDGAEFRSSLAPNLTHFGSRTTLGSATFVHTTENLYSWIENPPAMKPMDPDRNEIAEGRILGMPDFGLGPDEIEGLVALLDSWQ